MIDIKDVKKQYGKFCLDCSLEVPAGRITGLIGRNGAGKSTMFKAILGLIRTDRGEIKLFDKKVEELSAKEKEKIGVVLADSGFSGYLSIKDLLPILDSMYEKFQKEEFIQQCQRFELPLDKKLKEFSTGMKRKLQILAAMSHGAQLLLLDEPTAGLDVIAREELLDMIREYMEQEDRTILISSHISGDLEGLCDDLYMIDDGKILLHEDTDVLLDEYAMLKMSKEQYAQLDQTGILSVKEENFGYSCLTNNKQFYTENYPKLAIEKGSIDDVIMMMVRGNRAASK